MLTSPRTVVLLVLILASIAYYYLFSGRARMSEASIPASPPSTLPELGGEALETKVREAEKQIGLLAERVERLEKEDSFDAEDDVAAAAAAMASTPMIFLAAQAQAQQQAQQAQAQASQAQRGGAPEIEDITEEEDEEEEANESDGIRAASPPPPAPPVQASASSVTTAAGGPKKEKKTALPGAARPLPRRSGARS